MQDQKTNSAEKLDELLAEKAGLIRQKAIQGLDQYLVEFETAFQQGKGKLHWAYSSDDAFQIVLKLIDSLNTNDVLIAKGPLIDELEIDTRLGNKAHLDISTDKGSNNKPSIFVSGAAFFSADFPSVYFPEKGDSKYLAKKDSTTILLVSIDQLTPTLVDMNSLAMLLSKYQSDAFELVSLLNKSKLHLVLVDNGRSGLLGRSPQNRILEIGHPNYFTKNLDTKNSYVNRLYNEQLNNEEAINKADSYCADGYTSNSLMLKVPLNEIIIGNRELKAEKQKSESDLIWRSWKSAMLSRKVLNRSNLGLISVMKQFYKRGFGKLRSFPKVEKGNSFSEKWVKERPDIVQSKKLTDIPKGQLLVRKPATDGLKD